MHYEINTAHFCEIKLLHHVTNSDALQQLKPILKTSQQLVDFMYSLFNPNTFNYQEEIIVLFLNHQYNLIGYQKHSTGTMTYAVVDVRIMLTAALLCGATQIMVVHNHPSGNPEPSAADKKLSQKIAAAASTLDIKLLDFLIIYSGVYFGDPISIDATSFNQNGLEEFLNP